MATAAASPAPARSRALSAAGLGLLLLVALFYLLGAASDLAAVAGHNLPTDHRGTFAKLTGTSFSHLQAAAPGQASYISLLERGYALHELTFALLFIVVLAIPFRRRQRWSWWAAWLPMIANLGYSLTFGLHDPAILARSLIADIALPVLLLAHIPAFFARPRSAAPDAPAAHQLGR
ncbi:MAG TPA: hypothetical protein VFV41_12755 [Streptosporangiaceae bacterium]|nr:hypothetical protein [Streptosporangiaceae bacterium]